MANHSPQYTTEDLAFFMQPQFCEARADAAPASCNEGCECWARFGPPCLHRRGHCVGCGGRPRMLLVDRHPRQSRS